MFLFRQIYCQYIYFSQVSSDGRFESLIYCYIIVFHSKGASPGFGALFAVQTVFIAYVVAYFLTGRVLVRCMLILTFSHSQTIADGFYLGDLIEDFHLVTPTYPDSQTQQWQQEVVTIHRPLGYGPSTLPLSILSLSGGWV